MTNASKSPSRPGARPTGCHHHRPVHPRPSRSRDGSSRRPNAGTSTPRNSSACSLATCPELARVHELVREFAAMLDQRDATALPGWLDALTTSGHPTLAGLAKGIREDQDAAILGIATRYSSGMNEGRVNDVKLQKRITSGRAGVPLLRQRVVLNAHLKRQSAEETTPAR
ncbi:transposase [Streptomyces sp. NPDC003006]